MHELVLVCVCVEDLLAACNCPFLKKMYAFMQNCKFMCKLYAFLSIIHT